MQGHPNPPFSKKVQRGDQGKFLKNGTKSSPRLKGLKALWRKWHYPLGARMAKLWQFSEGDPKPAFSEKKQRGDQEKLLKKSPKKYPSPRALWRKFHYPLICIHLYCKDWTRFWRIRRLQKCRNGQVMAIFARSPKPTFSEKVQKGDEGKFFKNRPKGSPRLKNL